MNKKKRATTIFAVMVMICMMSMTVLAVTNKTITLPKNQTWTSKKSISRTGNYSYIKASLDSVYPEKGRDNFRKIQTRVVNSSGTLIMTSDYKVLKEGSGYKKLYIKDGYLGNKKVYIQFRGNTKASAKAVVNYKGL